MYRKKMFLNVILKTGKINKHTWMYLSKQHIITAHGNTYCNNLLDKPELLHHQICFVLFPNLSNKIQKTILHLH